MNAASQAVRFWHNRGHTPVAIYNGFEVLLDDNMSDLSWLRVDTWTTLGGSELGTNRTLPRVKSPPHSNGITSIVCSSSVALNLSTQSSFSSKIEHIIRACKYR